jgi:hypothetical protein
LYIQPPPSEPFFILYHPERLRQPRKVLVLPPPVNAYLARKDYDSHQVRRLAEIRVYMIGALSGGGPK